MKKIILLLLISFIGTLAYSQATKTLINANGVYTITPNQYVLAADTFYFAAIGDTANTLLSKPRAAEIYATKAENALKLAIADTNHFAHISDTTGAVSFAGAEWVTGKFATIANDNSRLLASDTTNIVATYTDIVNSAYVYAADGGSTDAYAITIPGFKGFVAGQLLTFKANTINTGACTLAVNGGTAKDLKIMNDQDPPDGYIEALQIVLCIYNGTNLQIINTDSNP